MEVGHHVATTDMQAGAATLEISPVTVEELPRVLPVMHLEAMVVRLSVVAHVVMLIQAHGRAISQGFV